jgi:hypothetical protein
MTFSALESSLRSAQPKLAWLATAALRPHGMSLQTSETQRFNTSSSKKIPGGNPSEPDRMPERNRESHSIADDRDQAAGSPDSSRSLNDCCWHKASVCAVQGMSGVRRKTDLPACRLSARTSHFDPHRTCPIRTGDSFEEQLKSVRCERPT